MTTIFEDLNSLFQPEKPYTDVTQACHALQRIARFLEAPNIAQFLGEFRQQTKETLREVCFVDAKLLYAATFGRQPPASQSRAFYLKKTHEVLGYIRCLRQQLEGPGEERESLEQLSWSYQLKKRVDALSMDHEHQLSPEDAGAQVHQFLEGLERLYFMEKETKPNLTFERVLEHLGELFHAWKRILWEKSEQRVGGMLRQRAGLALDLQGYLRRYKSNSGLLLALGPGRGKQLAELVRLQVVPEEEPCFTECVDWVLMVGVEARGQQPSAGSVEEALNLQFRDVGLSKALRGHQISTQNDYLQLLAFLASGQAVFPEEVSVLQRVKAGFDDAKETCLKIMEKTGAIGFRGVKELPLEKALKLVQDLPAMQRAALGQDLQPVQVQVKARRLQKYIAGNFPGLDEGAALQEAFRSIATFVKQIQILTGQLAPLPYAFELLYAQIQATPPLNYTTVFRKVARKAARLTFQAIEEETVLLTKDVTGFSAQGKQDVQDIEELPAARQKEFFDHVFRDELELAGYLKKLLDRQAYLQGELKQWGELLVDSKTRFQKLATKETLTMVQDAPDIEQFLAATQAVRESLRSECQQGFKKQLEKISRVEARELNLVLEQAKLPGEVWSGVADAVVNTLASQGELMKTISPETTLFNQRRFIGDLVKALSENLGPIIAEAQKAYNEKMRPEILEQLKLAKEQHGKEAFTAAVYQIQSKVRGKKTLKQTLQEIGGENAGDSEGATTDTQTAQLIAVLLWIDGDAEALLT